MKLKFVTCSGANEHTNIDELVAVLASSTKMEAGIQVSGKKASFGTARYLWIKALYYKLSQERRSVNLALHLNQDWVEAFCSGKVVSELSEFLSWKNVLGEPFFKRVQLNFRIGREKTPNIDTLVAVMTQYPDVRFILSYNESNARFIKTLHGIGCHFDCLFDNSHGEGITAERYETPVFDDVLQGYSGGISPENVVSVLDKISQSVDDEREIFIDAEGKLKGNDGYFCIEACKKYLQRALSY